MPSDHQTPDPEIASETNTHANSDAEPMSGSMSSSDGTDGEAADDVQSEPHQQPDLEPGEDLQEYYRGGDESSNGEEENDEDYEDCHVDEGAADSYDEASGSSEDDEEFAERALQDFEDQQGSADVEEHQGQRIQLVEHTTPDAMLYAPPSTDTADPETNPFSASTNGQPTKILTSNIAQGSLLKYGTPISVPKCAFTGDDALLTLPPTDGAAGVRPESAGHHDGRTQSSPSLEEILAVALGSTSSGSSASGASKKGMQQVIDMILPPIVWEQDGQLWMQQVSSKPATRLDVLNLQRLLDIRLEHRQAKETGICPIRRELYTQAFDEMIRQVTVNCAERGLLLLRVRDELKMTLSAYQTLFESSCAFGIRKTLQAREGREELERKVENLEKEKRSLLEECDRLRGQLEDAKRLHDEQRAVEAESHREKVEFYQHKVQQIKNQLEAILAAKK